MIKQTMAGISSWAINTLKEKVSATDVQQRLERTVAFKVFNQFIGLSIPFVSRNGFKVVAVAPGYVKALVPLQGNQNHMKTMYAGAMFLLAEVPGGVIAWFDFGQSYIPILRDMKMEFIAMGKSDLTVEFRLPLEEIARLKREADENGKVHFELTADLTDKEGKVVAKSSARYQLRKAR